MTQQGTYTSPFIYVIAFVLAIHMFPLPFMEYPYLVDNGPSWFGLDVSWQMVLNYALKNNWVWGEDIIYTYGPLGFLSTRIGWGIPRIVFLIFDLFVVLNFFHVFKDFLKASASKLVGLLILVTAILLMNFNHGTDTSWLFLFFILYWLYRSFSRPTFFAFLMIVILTTVAFYIKVNTGLISVILVSVHLVLLYFTDKLSVCKCALVLGSLFATLLISSFLLHVHLVSYVSRAFEIIKGYNAVMHMNNSETRVENNLGLIYHMSKYLVMIYFVYILLKGKFTQFFFLGATALYLLLLKKQAFLRGDTQHLFEFLCYGPLIFLTGNFLYYKNDTQKLFSSAILFIMTLALFFKTEQGAKVDELFSRRISSVGTYFNEWGKSKDVDYLTQQNKRKIPGAILSKIGTATIDVFPWDSEYILENKLNYSPRPVFQSFSAYTEKLQKVNYDFYLNKGPKYILFDYEAIDNRNPFNEEPLLHYFILKNYTLSDTFTSNERLRSLLVRNTAVLPLQIQKTGNQTLRINEPIAVAGNANFWKIKVKENLRGRKAAFSMRPSQVDIEFTCSDGTSRRYKTSTELLKAGVAVDNLLINHLDFLSLLTQKEFISGITNVKIIADAAYFQNEIDIEYYTVK